MKPTPETNAFSIQLKTICGQKKWVPVDFSRKLERERNEAREKLENEMKWHHQTHSELVQTQCKLLDMQIWRDEIQGKYDNEATEHMLSINKICNERDNALKALMEIEDLFIDGTDVYEDKEKMGKIAIAALEENNE